MLQEIWKKVTLANTLTPDQRTQLPRKQEADQHVKGHIKKSRCSIDQKNNCQGILPVAAMTGLKNRSLGTSASIPYNFLNL